jgi:hypothetical protein
MYKNSEMNGFINQIITNKKPLIKGLGIILDHLSNNYTPLPIIIS